jgi:hypothetical protein
MDSAPASRPIPEGHSANQSLSAVEPVSAPPKRKLEKRQQRPAPETRPVKAEIPEIANQRLGHPSLTSLCRRLEHDLKKVAELFDKIRRPARQSRARGRPACVPTQEKRDAPHCFDLGQSRALLPCGRMRQMRRPGQIQRAGPAQCLLRQPSPEMKVLAALAPGSSWVMAKRLLFLINETQDVDHDNERLFRAGPGQASGGRIFSRCRCGARPGAPGLHWWLRLARLIFDADRITTRPSDDQADAPPVIVHPPNLLLAVCTPRSRQGPRLHQQMQSKTKRERARP